MNLSTLLGYVKNRLTEATTYAGIVAAITGAAALESPYNHIAVVAGILAAVLPSPGAKQ